MRSFIRVITLRRMRCVGRVARMGEMRNGYRILVEHPEGRRILKWILKKQSVKMWAGFIRLRIGTSDEFLWIQY